MFPRAILVLALALATSAGAHGQAAVPDSLWRQYLAFLSDQGGIWLASNQQYRTDRSREPQAFLMRYWEGFGGTSLHGCMWGESSGESPVVLWQFFTAWDPRRKSLLVHQAAANGVIGLGYESPVTGVAEHTFTAPDGNRRKLRQESYSAGPDTLVTQNFRWGGEGWLLERTYTWIRQDPDSVESPCG